MIEKILERLEEERKICLDESALISASCIERMKEIVQEVAKEHRKLNRCDTCNHYVADEVPPICYFCCKGMEDNYQQKGE